MVFIYKLEVSNGGKEKVVLRLATTLAWEHLGRQRDPGSPRNFPAPSARGPGTGQGSLTIASQQRLCFVMRLLGSGITIPKHRVSAYVTLFKFSALPPLFFRC